MPIDFPSSPSLNQTYTYNGRTWRWNGEGWQLETAVPTGSIGTAELADGAVTDAKLATGLSPELAAGTAAAPSLSGPSDPDTGLWFPAANTWALSSGGAELVRGTSDGYLRMASGTGGIQFGDDTAAANALNDYEEGTWTPTASFNGASSGMTYSSQSGHYVKIGNQVTIGFRLGISNKGSSSGNLRIEGLPFSPDTAAKRASGVLGESIGTVASPSYVRTEVGLAYMGVFKASTSGVSAVTNSDFTTLDTYGAVTFQL